MSKKSKKKLKKKERLALLKASANSRKTRKPEKKSVKKTAPKVSADRNGHAVAKVKKGRLVYFFGDGRSLSLIHI